MNLKPQSNKIPTPSPASPTWGELADTGQPASVVVFECAGATYTYPYHTFSRWLLTPGTTETIRIQAGTDEVTIQGRNLRPICDALGSARLRVLRATNERYQLPEEAVLVSLIGVTTQPTG